MLIVNPSQALTHLRSAVTRQHGPPTEIINFFRNQEEDDAVIFGCLVMVLKTLVIVSGMQLMRYGRDDGTGGLPKIRALGMLLALLIGPIMEASAYAFAPQSLLAPINGLDVIWNILLSPFLLNESLTGSRIAGTILVFLGSVLAPIAGPHDTSALDLNRLNQIFMSSSFLIYLIVCTSLAAFGLAELQRRQRHGSDSPDVIRGLLIGVGGGALAGQNYFLRALAGLANSTFAERSHWNAWLHPLPIFLVVALLFCLFSNAFLLNWGLAEFEAMFMVPLFVGSSILISCVSATWVMHETSDLSVPRLAGYWFGISIVVLGIAVLATYAKHSKKSNSEDCRKDGGAELKA